MKQEELVSFARDIFEKAKENLKRDGHLTPVVIAKCADLSKDALLPLPWRSDEEKQIYCTSATKFLKQKHCYAYALVAEIWMVVTEPKEDLGCKPSEHPERSSAIMVTAEDAEQHRIAILAKIGIDSTVYDVQETSPNSGETFENFLLPVFKSDLSLH